MAIELQSGLEGSSDSSIFAHFIGDDIGQTVLPLDALPPGRRDDLLVYHASFGEPAVTQWLLSRPERLAIVYHNITPADFFIAHNAAFAAGLHWGRHELTLLRDRVVAAVAVSEFNARDLTELGFSNVRVIAAGVHPSRLAAYEPVGELAVELSERFPEGHVLAVSQVLPHKQFEVLLGAMHLVQWVHGLRLGLAVVGALRSSEYATSLHRFAQRLNVRDVHFFGAQTDRQLATHYRMANIYATTSAHEGLALPPLEAMSFGVPVIAREAGALAETIDAGGVVLPSSSGALLMSEAIAEMARNTDLRRTMQRRGHARVAEIESRNSVKQFVDFMKEH